LLGNDRNQIELFTTLLLSLPGSPIIYYGDEIGMGDNVWLGDRDGVRTPMQWTPDRNGGFSTADPQRLYLQTLTDPIYGYQAINVEAQQRNPGSLLHWTKRMIEIRKRHPVFGLGGYEELSSSNPSVLAFVREHPEAGDPEAQRLVAAEHPAREDSDAPEDDYSVLDADSSQRHAIDTVLAGQSLVIHGPPGTGKSQTIANLIAALVAHGRKVLFVAEKRAAIDAVLSRLKGVELGDMVLDIHEGTRDRQRIARSHAGRGSVDHKIEARRIGFLGGRDLVTVAAETRDQLAVMVRELSRVYSQPELPHVDH